MINRDCEILFPASIQSTESGYDCLIDALFPLLYADSGTLIRFDFSLVKWIPANLLAIIGAAIELRLIDCTILYKNGSIAENQADLWGRNGFGRYFSLNTPKRGNTIVDYKVFLADGAKSFGAYIDDGLLKIPNLPKMSCQLKKKISNNLQEIFGNAPLHGNCERVISCGQYFPSTHTLSFTIANCGNTIQENVVEYFSHLCCTTPSHAIQWACIENNSTKSMVNGKSGGMGLALLKEFILLNKGSIQICSGNEFWELKEEKEECSTISSNFPGTIVTININMNDHSTYMLASEAMADHNLF